MLDQILKDIGSSADSASAKKADSGKSFSQFIQDFAAQTGISDKYTQSASGTTSTQQSTSNTSAATAAPKTATGNASSNAPSETAQKSSSSSSSETGSTTLNPTVTSGSGTENATGAGNTTATTETVNTAALEKAVAQSEAEGYTAATASDYVAAFEGFEDIEAPGTPAEGMIRFTLKGGKKFFLRETDNPKMFKAIANFYAVRQEIAQYPEHRLLTEKDIPPDVSAFTSKDQIKQLDNGLLVYETDDGQKCIIYKETAPKLYQTLSNLLESLTEEAHANAFQNVPESYTRVTQEEAAPPASDIRSMKIEDVEDGGKVILYTTHENKQFAVSSLQTPALFQTLQTHFAALQSVDTLNKAGFEAVTDLSTPLPDIKDIKKAGWSDGIQSGVTAYELQSGEKKSVSATDNPDLYAHIQGANEFLSAPEAHQSAVNDYRDNQGYELATMQTAGFSYSNIESMEFVSESDRTSTADPQLEDPRTGIVLVTTKDGKKIVVSERFTPFMFEDLKSKQENYTQIQDYIAQGYSWADENTPSVSLDADVKYEVIGDGSAGVYAFTVDGKKYLASSDLVNTEDAALLKEYGALVAKGETPSEEMEARVQGIKPIPFVNTVFANVNTAGLDEEIRNKIIDISKDSSVQLLSSQEPVLSNAELQSPDLMDKITNYDTSDAEKSGIIRFTYNGKDYAVSSALNPDVFAAIQAGVANKEGFEQSLNDGYRKATEGDYDLDIEEVSKLGEFGSQVLRFTTTSGEKIVVNANDDPYLFNEAYAAYAEKVDSETQEVREKYNLPSKESTSITQLPTDVTINGETQNVQAVAFSNLYNEYVNLYNSGELSEDDPRFKLVRYIEHQQLLNNGMQILPYIEEHGARLGNDTVRKFKKDGDGNPDYVMLTPADMAELIDGRGLENELSGLLAEGTVAADYQKYISKTITQNVDTDAFLSNLEEQITSTNFTQAMADLTLAGKTDVVNQMTQDMLQSVVLVAPERVAEFQSLIVANTTAAMMERNLRNPEGVPAEIRQTANEDVSALMINEIQTYLGSETAGDTQLAALQTYMGNEENTARLQGYITEFISQNGGSTDSQAVIDFVDQKIASGELTTADKTALQSTLGILVANDMLSYMQDLSDVSASYYNIVGGAEAAGAGWEERMGGILSDLVPTLGSTASTDEVTKEKLATLLDQDTAADNSQNMNMQSQPKQQDQASIHQEQAGKIFNHWGMNLGSGAMEVVFGFANFARSRDAIENSFTSEAWYKTSTAGEIMMMAGGGAQAGYGATQLATKTSIAQKFLPTTMQPAAAKINASLNNPASAIQNTVIGGSSVLFGAGMLAMGIAGLNMKHADTATKAGMGLMTGMGGLTTAGGITHMLAAPVASLGNALQAPLRTPALLGSMYGLKTAASSTSSLTAMSSPIGSLAKAGSALTKVAGAMGLVGAATGAAGLVGGLALGGVFGGMQIKQGLAMGDKWNVAGGALNVVSSTVLSAGIAGMMAPTVTGTAAAASVLGVSAAALAGATAGAGFALMLPAILISLLIDEIRGDPTLHKVNDKETSMLQKVEKDGFLREGAWDKLEFYRYNTYMNNGRAELKDDESMLETQKPMWDHFSATEGKNGSSENRIDKNLLVDIDK